MANFTRETIRIPSSLDGVFLDVWYYKPKGTAPFPVVVAGHGMTVIKDAGYAAFGERWAEEAGFASLIFDYRYFGDSGGEPRNLVSLDKQIEDYRSVIKWARQRPEEFLNDKVVVMGSAMSGLSVGTLVLEDSALAGGMAHSPVLDGYATLMSAGFNPRLMFWATVDLIKAKLGLAPVFVNAVGEKGEFALLNTASSHAGFTSMFSQGSTPFSQAPNLITPRVIFDFMGTRPGPQLAKAHCPVLIVYTKEDDIIPAKIAQDIGAGAPNRVTLVEASGGHFDIMKGGQSFETNINAQIEFLRRLL